MTAGSGPAATPGAPGPAGDRALLAPLLALLCSAAVYLALFWGSLAEELGQLRILAAVLLASLPFAVAARAAQRPASGRPQVEWLLLLGGLALLRLCIPLDTICGSDDAYRYLWDGRVLDHGFNPFAHAPQDPALARLREPIFFPHIFRPDMRTVYPPLAQLWFWVAYRLTPTSFAGLKLVLLVHDLASTLLLARLLRAAGQPVRRALIYAWSPLVVTQLYAGVHLDGLLVPWMLLALLLADRRPLAAGAALAAAAMVRPVMVLCLPALALRRPARQTAAVGLGFAAASALALAPLASAGRKLVESLLVYSEHWNFNGSLYRLSELLPLGKGHQRLVLYAVISLLGLAGAWLPVGLPGRFLFALGSYFALAPTVYPWYLLGVVALGTLLGGTLVVALPLLVSLSDLVWLEFVDSGRWRVPALALWLEYGLIYGLLLADLWRWRARRRAAAGAERRP
jgi:hypothetical protein